MELERKKAMKKAIFIWQISPIFSSPGSAYGYGGIGRVKAVKFCKKLQEAIEEKQSDYEVVLDDTSADVYELVKQEFDMLIFAPGGKTRFFIPKELKQQLEGISKVYLEMLEYHNLDVAKTVEMMC